MILPELILSISMLLTIVTLFYNISNNDERNKSHPIVRDFIYKSSLWLLPGEGSLRGPIQMPYWNGDCTISKEVNDIIIKILKIQIDKIYNNIFNNHQDQIENRGFTLTYNDVKPYYKELELLIDSLKKEIELEEKIYNGFYSMLKNVFR